MIAMTLYLTVSGVWNTGVIVDHKIKTQAVADAAAQASAARIASALNEMAMLNMLAMRSSSAMALYDAYMTTAIAGMIGAGIYAGVQFAIFIASCLALAPNFDALKQAIEATMDTITLGIFLSKILLSSRNCV